MEIFVPLFIGAMCLIAMYSYYHATKAGMARGISKKALVIATAIETFLLFMAANMVSIAFTGQWLWEY